MSGKAASGIGGHKKSPLEQSRGLGSLYQIFTELAERTGLEPAISGVTGRHSNRLNYRSGAHAYRVVWPCGGRNRDRTCDIRLVRPTLSQLSYSPPRQQKRDSFLLASPSGVKRKVRLARQRG